MNKLIISAVALAATTQPALADGTAAQTGPYLGVQVSVAKAQDKHSDPQGWFNGVSDFRLEKSGAIGGVHAGYDLGKGAVVAGVEAEVNFGVLDTFAETSPTYTQYMIGSRTTLLGSARAKVGLRSGKLTGTVSGGYAFSNSKHNYFETDGSPNYFNDKGSRSGWVLGFGFDYAVSKHTSIGLSASHYQFALRDHQLLDSTGALIDCSWSSAADNLCHFPMRDKFETVTVAYRYHF